MPVTRILTSIVLAFCLVSAVLAQDSGTQAQDAKTQNMLDQAKENGRQVQVAVNGNISAQAVLIPQVDARRIFGKEVADNYAVIEVNVSNKSQDATLLIHSIYIDYSRWALSGASSRPDITDPDPMSTYQASTRPSHVASEERRIVRGQLLDAQLSTKRNRWIKWLTLAGSVAAAYTFSLNERGIIRGISAFNGVVIPGLDATFPDPVIAQLNRISDFGFATNTPVPRQGGEIVVCFFPIDRFLTPGFRKLFLKSPALFFAPLQMLVDDNSKTLLESALGQDLGLNPEDLGVSRGQVRDTLRESLPCYLRLVKDTDYGTTPHTLLDQMYQNADLRCLDAFGLEEETDANGARTGRIRLIGSGDKTPPPSRKISESRTSSESKTTSESRAVPESKTTFESRTTSENKTTSESVQPPADKAPATPAQKFARFMALDYISQASLNHIKVTIDGVMSVDTSVIAAKIDDVTLDDADGCTPKQECFWTVPADGSLVRTGTIKGSYLTNGSVTIDEANDLHITEITPVAEGSTDQTLHFSMKLTQTVPSGKTLTFKVTKPRPGVTTKLESQPWIYAVGFLPSTRTLEANIDAAGKTVTLSNLGPPLTGDEAALLTVALVSPSPEALPESVLNKRFADGTIQVDIPDGKKIPGCWTVKVKSGESDIRVINEFEVAPSPKLDANAKLDGNEIVVTGTGLIDTANCGGKLLRFQLVKKDAGNDDKPIPLTVDTGKSTPETERHLKLPPEAKSGDWVIQLRRGDDAPISESALSIK
ncbi:MAG TPA: hypothetical protein VLJ61_19500 [Pyrinomonadaceae bacterium]|nr:hypothetical protein [Pyrinomonadaceae bacterium]